MLMPPELWYRWLCRYWVADLGSSDLAPEREEQLLRLFLRDPGGVHPDAVGPVGDLLSLALTSSAWRNTRVERWHATGVLSDGEMMRVNSHTARSVRQRVRRWLAERQLSADAPVSALGPVRGEEVCELAASVYGWLVSRRRRLPTGTTLGDLVGGDLTRYAYDADKALTDFAALAADRGVRFAFLRGAAHGALACHHWWGHPNWPVTVDRFIGALDNPLDRHWGEDGEYRCRLPPEPADVADRRRLRRTLLSAPWRLSPDAAEWVAAANLGYLYY